MTILRYSAAVFSGVFSFALICPVMAQGMSDPPGAAADGAPVETGRGVRIIPAETAAPPSVAKPPQPAPPAANAVKPAPATMVSGHPPAPPVPVLKPCDRPIARPAVRFSDPARLDRTLRGKLRGGRTVVVDMETPYPVKNEAPAPLGAWLNEVEKSGGTITVSPYCQKGRGIGGFFARIFGGEPAEPYKAARRYDAILHVDSIDQIVTQVEFTRRKATR